MEENNLDIQYMGDSRVWKIITKVWSEDDEWCDTTMAMEVPGGIALRTQYNSTDGCSETMIFIPNAKLEEKEDNTYKIV